MSPTRPFYWSVRRELWENRSIYIAPLIAAGVVLFGFVITRVRSAASVGATRWRSNPAQQRAAIEMPYDIAAMMIMFTAFIVGIFYCLDALHGERRDRSILFWKSLPVSDLTTVLSKAIIPLAVLPLLTFAHRRRAVDHAAARRAQSCSSHGLSPATTWAHVPLFQNWIVLLYGLVAIALWHAPIYGWLLLVSGWARRATFLWAVLPLHRDPNLREDCVRHFVFRRPAEIPPDGFRAGSLRLPRRAPTIDPLTQLTPGDT